MTHIFGLTGGIASGKSTVAGRFASHGVPVLDADKLAREVMATGSPTLRGIVVAFGPEMINQGGELDRKRLGDLVFSDPAALQRLNALVHPEVAALFAQKSAELDARGVPLICYDIPLLFERDLQDSLRPVVVVTVSPELQLERLTLRDKLTQSQARARIATQLSLEEKVRHADYVIDNSGPPERTLQQADHILQAIRNSLNL